MMPFDALRFFLPGFFVLFVLGIFNPTCPANAQSQSGQARTTPARQYPAAKRGLSFAVGERGLTSLEFNGQTLLISAERGELRPSKSLLRQALDTLLLPGSEVDSWDREMQLSTPTSAAHAMP